MKTLSVSCRTGALNDFLRKDRKEKKNALFEGNYLLYKFIQQVFHSTYVKPIVDIYGSNYDEDYRRIIYPLHESDDAKRKLARIARLIYKGRHEKNFELDRGIRLESTGFYFQFISNNNNVEYGKHGGSYFLPFMVKGRTYEGFNFELCVRSTSIILLLEVYFAGDRRI